ncbi:MAG: NUDIX domain-containing protein [Acetatifactor sp.]|nr:NUDIX domain-containing protein [Acetatifactor sp.]
MFKVNELQQYKFVVVLSKYQGKILRSRHNDRTTWETQGGHIEPGEMPLEAAERELYEEAGAMEFDIKPVCDYCVGEETAGGMAFVADIRRLEDIPDSEMAEVRTFDELPGNLTYPDITPVLFAQISADR